jgi:predicted metalloprotease with PDZ domain
MKEKGKTNIARVYAALFLLPFSFFLSSYPAWSQPLDPIRYTVSFPAPHTHYVEVDASFPTAGQAHIDLMMPVWTPGSYLVREYSRHVEGLTAAEPGGSPLGVEKTRKNRWRVTTNGARTISVRYRVFAHELSVRTNWVDDEFALLNGAATFITLLEARDRPHDVRLVLPSFWERSFSGMPSGADTGSYRAPDYDALVDSPILAGNPAVYEFAAGGRQHYLVDFRERGAWQGARAVQDLAKVAMEVARFWGTVPHDRFFFFNIIGGPVNGLEHRNATVMTTPAGSTDARAPYLTWLSTSAHEYFHSWNVKRLRPIELGPFDYENEVYTKGLWFAEGVTDYYADLHVHRSGVSNRDEYLEALSDTITALQTTPGRLEQSAERASYDAWIKYYRRDENTDNTSISYYTKGTVIGFLLDAKIRRLTSGAKSLDDLMRLMYQRFSGAKGFTSEDLRATAADLVGPEGREDMRRWLVQALETTQELDYREALEWFGLRIGQKPGTPRGWLGLKTRTENQHTIVTEILRGSPAFAAGLSLNDRIVSIDGVAVAPGVLEALIAQRAPGTRISLELGRSDAVRVVGVVLGSDPGHQWSLGVTPAATPEQTRHLDDWLQ